MTSTVSEDRRAMVDRAREAWITRLIDRSRRNNLLYYRPLKTGTLDVSTAAPEALAGLLAGRKTPLSSLVGPDALAEASVRAQQIRRRALANLEERGLETLRLAVGTASWTPSDEGRPAEAAVVLVPVSVESRGRASEALSLHRDGEAQVNPVLLDVLEFDLGVEIEPRGLLDGEPSIPEDAPVVIEPVLERLARAAAQVRGFATSTRAVLGNFAFQKMAMVRDIRECREELAAHDLVAALAGDPEARRTVLAGRSEVDPAGLDLIPAGSEFLVLDADFSQERVVQAVLGGQNGVVQGPPGTGKSQTIANLIASLAAGGRRVLFVAEKRAALEAVLKRLEQVGLGHLALDLHGADVSRRTVMAEIAESLDAVREAGAVDAERLHREFEDRRERLNAHLRAMHTPAPPSGKTVYQLQGELMSTPAEVRAATRWRGPDLDLLSEEAASRVSDLLVEAGGFDRLFLWTDPSPWTRAELLDRAAATEAIDLAAGLSRDWPAVRRGVEQVAQAAVLSTPATLASACTAIGLLREVDATLEAYDPPVFELELAAISSALAPALSGRVSTLLAWVLHRRFRAARRQLVAVRREPAASSRLAGEARAAADQLETWRRTAAGSSLPRSVEGSAEVDAALEDFAARTRRLGAAWPGWRPSRSPSTPSARSCRASHRTRPRRRAFPTCGRSRRSWRTSVRGPSSPSSGRRSLRPPGGPSGSGSDGWPPAWTGPASSIPAWRGSTAGPTTTSCRTSAVSTRSGCGWRRPGSSDRTPNASSPR